MIVIWIMSGFTGRWRLSLYLTVMCLLYMPLLMNCFSVERPRRNGRGIGRVSSQLYRHSTSSLKASSVTSSGNDRRNIQRPLDKLPRGGAPNKRTALKWVVQSIERFAQDPKFSVEKPSPQLLDALYRLQRARTQGEVAEAGRLLESLDIAATESVEVQERVIKALSISGLLSLASDLLDSFIEKEILPSSIAYVAVCNSLRKAGRIQRLEQLLYQLGSIATEAPIDVLAFNTLLAALCDNIEDTARLEHARDWLRPGVSSERLGGTNPDASSYSTVLHAAASMGNSRIVDELWEELTITRKLQPTIYAYNALLRSAKNRPDGNVQALDVLDRLMKDVQPDRYTIDLVLVPLIRANRIGDIEGMLGNLVESQSVDRRTASNAFVAYLNTLIKAGELPMAQALFDTYLLPSLSSTSVPVTSIRPTVLHFNLLIEGYKRSAIVSQGSLDDNEIHETTLVGPCLVDPDVNPSLEARDNGSALYNTMLEAGIKPDEYTLTSMLGLSFSAEEVTEVFQNAVTNLGLEVTPAVARALITAYGNLGDPSSACVAFDTFAAGTMNARTWNTLLSALARISTDRAAVIHIGSSTPALILANSSVTDVLCKGVCKLVDGLSTFDAVRRILGVMERHGDQDASIFHAPGPNAQTFCITASALQTGPANSTLAMELFRTATRLTASGDGRFINAVFRCFGDDIEGALSAWKSEVRRFCLAHEHRRRSTPPSSRRKKGKNLIAAYHGLLYVCGRALRPDIALRLVYAMNKEELEPNEMALNCYRSGKGTRQKLLTLDSGLEEKSGIELAMANQFESVLLLECTKYDKNDKRRAGEKRVRIIL